MKDSVKIGRRGKDLWFRIPKSLVEKFDLKVGDVFDSKNLENALVESQSPDKCKVQDSSQSSSQ